MKVTKSLVLVRYSPYLTIKFYLNYIFSISPTVNLIFDHPNHCDSNLQWNLKKLASQRVALLCACLNVFNKDFGRVKNVAELTLHRDRMFKHPLMDLCNSQFVFKFSISFFNP